MNILGGYFVPYLLWLFQILSNCVFMGHNSIMEKCLCSSKHTSVSCCWYRPTSKPNVDHIVHLTQEANATRNLCPVSNILKAQGGHDINFATMEKGIVFWFCWSQEFGTNESQTLKYDAECVHRVDCLICATGSLRTKIQGYPFGPLSTTWPDHSWVSCWESSKKD